MADYDINNPNEYVPNSDESTAPRGGLSVLGGSAPANSPRLLGGLQGSNNQADLEKLLFSRVRDSDSLERGRVSRANSLAELQRSLNMPVDEMNGLEHIARGIANNDQPWDVGRGFQIGVAGAWDAKAAKTKQAREAAIMSAKAGMDFQQNEEKIESDSEQTAIGNLRALAKPILNRGSTGSGIGGGVRFKTVAGIGLVDTQALDENGIPKVVIGDVKLATEMRAKARKLAEDQASDPRHQMVFSSDSERESFVQGRTDEIVGQMLGGTQAANSANMPQMRAGEQRAGATPMALPAGDASVQPTTSSPTSAKGWPAGTQLPTATQTGTSRYDVLSFELAEALKNGKTADAESLQREIARLPANERPTNAAVPQPAPAKKDFALTPPEGQAAKNKTAEELAKSQVETATQIKNNAAVGQSLISTVGELRQLKFSPGMFAEWKKKGGNFLEAIGQDGPLVRHAAQSRNAEALLQALSNARISLEKGVQTDQDEKRFKAEIAAITDPKAAYDYLLKHMEELGKKSREHYNFYENYRKNNGNLYDGADQAWQKRSDEFGGMVKRYQGGFIGRSEFIEQAVNNPNNLKAFGGDKQKLQERAEREWRNLGGK